MNIGDRKAKLERDIALAVAQLQEQFENETGALSNGSRSR